MQGDQALAQRRKALTARADHRVRDITTLVEDISNARWSFFASLTKKAVEGSLPRDWPRRFFQHGSPRGFKVEGPATESPTVRPSA